MKITEDSSLRSRKIKDNGSRWLHLSFISLYLLLSPFISPKIQAQYTVTHLERPINTEGSETGAFRLGDTVLVFSSMEAQTGKKGLFGTRTPVMKVYQARIARNGKVARPKEDRWGLNAKRWHTGNVAVDPLSYDLYFTRGDLESLDCEIWFARKKKRRGWEEPVKLKGEVNMQGYTSTHPTVARLADSTTILYFVSNRPGGLGGTDIWYTLVKDGRAQECVNLGPLVNSEHDEYTPFYDQRNGVLYFSSDRPGGKGGHDIYCAAGKRNSWQKAEAVCQCLNSEWNDLYFKITDYDSASGRPLAGFLASNREDSFFLTDSTCCNDIYKWKIDSSAFQQIPEPVDTTPPPTEVVSLSSFMFPLFLYFHNDDPDPQSREVVTETSYPECQRRMAALREEYVRRQSNADDSLLMNEFFDSCVVGNYNRVEELFDYIEALLDDGHSVTITIAGYASPVYKSDYNRNLSRRRIVSFINMVHHWRGGIFEDALLDGRFFIEQKPHGAVSPTTASQSTDPVWGLPAAMARRIEILGCEIR